MDIPAIDVLIVDDERKACSVLKGMLEKYTTLPMSMVGMAHNTREAEEQICATRPAVVFLDIEMPNDKAFQFLDRIAPFDFEVIFVTAFDEYAVKAFRLNAVDYILKPVSIADLRSAVGRLVERLAHKWQGQTWPVDYNKIGRQIANRTKHDKIILRDKNNMEVIGFDDVLFVEAQGSYSRIVFLKDGVLKDLVMSWLLTEYEELLPGDSFFRIHRSYLVNCSHITGITNEEAAFVTLRNQFRLMISRRNYGPLLSFLKSKTKQ